ncbi:MAG: CRISPR-associated endonuclease Cas2 [Verrucomicrobiales bacterium]|nr:CRISPR-associated endonuclease Cas2 [Verrucomicrobiales bacterium]MCP5525940.1 CRISPR-associated endonuclease Cas2 [Verrucomicrobiales bacterium]
MLRLVAYDITEPRRLQRIADICEDYGVRVQYSLFECWLDDDAFAALWSRLEATFDPEKDRLVAYTLDRAAEGRRQTAGATMQITRPVDCYIV